MDWQEERKQSILQAKNIVVKVGSAVLTNSTGLNMPLLENIVHQITELMAMGKRVTLVSSGAVAAGRAALREFKTDKALLEGLSGKQAAAAIGQGKLMHVYDEAFAKHHILSAQVLLTRDDFRNRERFLNARNTLTKLLDMHVIPIINENDTVAVHELKFGDNDALASYIINAVEATLSINLTSTGGVLSKNPQSMSEGEHIPLLTHIHDIEKIDINSLCGGKTSVGTGGMHSKLLSARRAAQLGVPTLILPGKEENIILKAFKESTLGTYICSSTTHVSRKKYWLAYQSAPQGIVHIDLGAEKALKESGKSLLPGGITTVEGNFKEGDLISIMAENNSIAVGLTNYSASQLKKIAGKKRIEVAVILGNAHYPEVIHRDNMLLNPVV